MKPLSTYIGYSTEAKTNCTTPPVSPGRHSSLPYCRSRRLLSCKSHIHRRRESSLVGIVLRLNILRYLLLLPLLYVSGLITCVGPLSAILHPRPLPGSKYRSHELFQKLWDHIQSDNSSAIELSTMWRCKRKLKEQKPCPNTTGQYFESLRSSRYLIVEANGGLNQQRSSICNAVALAGLLNATLVLPHFDFHSVWRDPSNFSDIYDEDHFITTLEGYVKVVPELPEELMERYDHNISKISNFRVPAWAPTNYYLEELFPVLHEQGVMRIAPFANRLAMKAPRYIQFLRCLTNYEALRFSFPISTLARKLINRMIERSSSSGGQYVSVHLRFEEDMVAFSCCVYDGGESEKSEMDLIREKGWGTKFKRKAYVITPDLNRINGKCPMTPLELYCRTDLKRQECVYIDKTPISVGMLVRQLVCFLCAYLSRLSILKFCPTSIVMVDHKKGLSPFSLGSHFDNSFCDRHCLIKWLLNMICLFF